MEFFVFFFKKRLLTFRLVFFVGFSCVSAVDTWVSFVTKLKFFFLLITKRSLTFHCFLFLGPLVSIGFLGKFRNET